MEPLAAELERISASCGGKLGAAAICIEHPERHCSLNGTLAPLIAFYPIIKMLAQRLLLAGWH